MAADDTPPVTSTPDPETTDARTHVVCISGSMRFEEQMRLAAIEESVAGRIVVMPHVNLKRPLPVTLPAGADPKPGLDALHLAKIDLADEVLVVCPGDYVGDSTRAEIAYAERIGKPVRRWLEPDEPAAPSVPDADGLRDRIRLAISDPGSVLHRDHGTDERPAETVSSWSARAVEAVIVPLLAEREVLSVPDTDKLRDLIHAAAHRGIKDWDTDYDSRAAEPVTNYVMGVVHYAIGRREASLRSDLALSRQQYARTVDELERIRGSREQVYVERARADAVRLGTTANNLVGAVGQYRDRAAALSLMVRGMARRVWAVRDQWIDASEERDALRELVAESTPTLPDDADERAYLRWCEWTDCLRSFDVRTGPRDDVDGKGWIYVRTGMPVLLCPDHANASHRPQRPEWQLGDTTISTACECGERSGELTPTNHAACMEWWRAHVLGLSTPTTDPAPTYTLDLSQIPDIPASVAQRVLRAAGMVGELEIGPADTTDPAPAADSEPPACPIHVFPAWANSWMPCGSPVRADGLCAKYGHAQPAAPQAPAEPTGCPDGGICHHSCPKTCFRVAHAEPLSGVFPDDRWPAGLSGLAAHTDDPVVDPDAFGAAGYLLRTDAGSVDPIGDYYRPEARWCDTCKTLAPAGHAHTDTTEEE